MVCWATGGPQKYTGKSMTESHKDLKITSKWRRSGDFNRRWISSRYPPSRAEGNRPQHPIGHCRQLRAGGGAAHNAEVSTSGGQGTRTARLEEVWIGIVAIGVAVHLSITGPCARYDTTLPRGDLPKCRGSCVRQPNNSNVDVYASVLQSGKVRRGDSVTME